jgi:hypothetical protein
MKKIPISILIVLFPIVLSGQQIKGYRSESGINFPKLTWYSTNTKDTSTYTIYRANVKENSFCRVQTLHRITIHPDTLFFRVTDTTLIEKGMYKYYIAMFSPTQKDSIIKSEVLYGHNMGHVASPHVVSFTAMSAKGQKAIELKWKLNYNFSVRSMTMYRSMKYETGYKPIAILSSDAESYTDPVELANEAYFYFLEINDFFGYQVPSIRVFGISDLKEKPYPPQDFKVNNDQKTATFSWRGVGDNIIGYRIYRSIGNSEIYSLLADHINSATRIVNYTDTTVSAYKNVALKYYAVAMSDGFVEGNTTDTLSIYSNTEILPGIPEECNILTDGQGNFKVVWTAQEKDVNLKGYNVYRSINGGGKILLNNGLIPYFRNYYIDTDNKCVGGFEYEIESVSITNSPSAVRKKVTIRVADPAMNLILSIQQSPNGIVISGEPIASAEVKEVLLYRRADQAEPMILARLSPDKIYYKDTKVTQGKFYTYSAMAVLKNGNKTEVNTGVGIRYE